MATSKDYDDLIPRPLPKPLPAEEICIKPEVPEISLLFDSSANQKSTLQNVHQNFNSVSLECNSTRLPLSSNVSSLPSHNFLNSPSFKTPLKLSDHNFSSKKVTFSPQLQDKTNFNIYISEPENIPCQCRKETNEYYSPNHNDKPRFNPKSIENATKKPCSCTSCSNNCDYSMENIDHNSLRLLKNLERKINTKVSYDDLQKTELKIENILLKHKCKYDKLGEICVSKEELNKILHRYENQINLLQSRVDDLTQKINSGYYERENNEFGEEKRASYSDNGTICSNHCCNHKNNYGSRQTRQRQMNQEQEINEQLPIGSQILRYSCHKAHQDTRQEEYEIQQNENALPNIRARTHFIEPTPAIQMNVKENFTTSCSEQTQLPTVHIKEPQIKNDNASLKATENEYRMDYALYSNIVENVKNLVEKSNNVDNCNTVDLIKKATMEQFQRLGINFENIQEQENVVQHIKSKPIPSNLAPSPETGFHVNSLAMKYVSEYPSEGEYKKSMSNDISFRSNGNNISIATLQYMERYHLLPSIEQKQGNSTGFNKYDQNMLHEQHQVPVQSQNNDRSFIYPDWRPKN